MPYTLRYHEGSSNSQRRTYVRKKCDRRVAEHSQYLADDWRAIAKQRSDTQLRIKENDYDLLGGLSQQKQQ